MAIQFLPPQYDGGFNQGLGSLLGGLGGGLLGGAVGYGVGSLGAGNADQEIEQLTRAGIFTPEQAKIYKKMKSPTERSSFLTQAMKQQENRRQSEIMSKTLAGGSLMQSPEVPQIGMGQPGGMQALGGLGQAQQSQMGMGQQPSVSNQMQQLLAQGLNPQNLNLMSNLLTSAEKTGLQRESLQAKKEAPHRVQVAKQVAEYQRKGELAERLIADYDAMKIMADNPQLRTGAWQQLLTQAGIPTAMQSDASFVADKLIGDITIASAMKTTTPGKLTARLLEEYAKVNPTRLSSPQGMKDTLELKKMSERIEKTIADKVNDIIDISPGGIPPINIIQRAMKESKPEIEKIHKEQQEFARKMVKDAKESLKPKGSLRIGKKYSGMPDPSKVARYRDPSTGIIMKRNAEGTGYIPE